MHDAKLMLVGANALLLIRCSWIWSVGRELGSQEVYLGSPLLELLAASGFGSQ